jgi:HK97 family phage major capsid protein
MGAADALVARLQGEAEERTKFMDGLVEAAEKDGRDLTEQEMSLLARARDRLKEIGDQVTPLQSAIEIAHTSRERTAAIARQFEAARGGPDAPKPMEYRSAGAYVLDVWRARMGNQEVAERLDLFNRAASHQTTGDNPGLLPEQILGPVVNYVDASRPLTSALGPRQLPSGSWSRPKVTQHTATAAQTPGEKTELVSQKMTIAKLPVSANTYGGYVNVSRQDIDWTQPSIMDLIINDLAGQYALDTENHTCSDLTAAAPAGPVIPTGTPSAEDVAGALWGAASTVIPAVGGQGRIIACAPPELMAILGPLFPPVGPSNSASAGFSVAAMQSGLAGSIAGIPVYVSNGMAANTILVLSTAAAEVYEDRIGALQVVEPSVLGVQVAYAGYFAELVVEAAGLSKIIKTP